MAKINVLLVDDHRMLLDSLGGYLMDSQEIDVIATATSGEEVKSILGSLPSLSVVVLDINMPNGDGFEVVCYLKKHHSHLKVLIMSMYKEIACIKEMYRLGVNGYILKNGNIESLIEGIKAVFNGEHFFGPEVMKLVDRHAILDEVQLAYGRLSLREIEILKLLFKGFTTIEISDILHSSIHTINSHRKHILQKLEAKNTAEAVWIAINKGIISSLGY